MWCGIVVSGRVHALRRAGSLLLAIPVLVLSVVELHLFGDPHMVEEKVFENFGLHQGSRWV